MSLQNHPIWRKPQHHHDLDHSHEHVHWVELFYDLVHVVTVFLLGNYLSHHASLEGFAVFALVFVVLFYAWGEISVYNSIYLSTDIWHRIIMSLAIITVMFMAAAIPSVTGNSWPFFALGFAANRFVIALLYFRARRINSEANSLCSEMVRNFVIFGLFFGLSAFLPKPYNFYVFVATMFATIAIYMIPKLSPIRFDRFVPRMEHLSERFGLLTLIVTGEAFFKLVVTLADKGAYKVSPEVLVNFGIGGIATFILAWTYFDVVGNGKPKDQQFKTLIFNWSGHIFLMISLVMIGVALSGEVKVGFWEPYPLKYGTIGCFGLAGYLISLWIIQKQIEFREAHRFARLDLRIFGIAMVFVTYFSLPYVPAIIGNLLWSTALCSQLGIGILRAYFYYKAQEKAST